MLILPMVEHGKKDFLEKFKTTNFKPQALLCSLWARKKGKCSMQKKEWYMANIDTPEGNMTQNVFKIIIIVIIKHNQGKNSGVKNEKSQKHLRKKNKT